MTTQCEHGQLRRQCEVCERDEQMAVAWSVLEGQREQIADLTARLAELVEALDDLIVLAESAMHAANRDGGEYDVDEALADARGALKKGRIKS